MSETLSDNTKAVLLLTGPLIAGRAGSRADLLTPGEYNKLARRLHEVGRTPADLVASDAAALALECGDVVDAARLERLLARGFLLSQAVERWQARAIWVVSRSDAAYPARLKASLKGNAPALLYGCGDAEILESGGLAVVGSRNADEALVEYTQEIGRLAARANRTLVSGGARGIDQAAMRGALEAGGKVTGVLACDLEKTAMTREHRDLLLERQLVLVSPYDPSARFHVGQAMARNKVVYALSDAGLVVSSDLGKGGTWAGATEQLDKLRLVPVYVRANGAVGGGLEGLLRKGAIPWPDPTDGDGVAAALEARVPDALPAADQRDLFGERAVETAATEVPDTAPSDPAEALFRAVRRLIESLLAEPMKAAEVASALGITKKQTDEWLKRLVDEGVLEKRARPVTYVARQASLFGAGDSA